MLRDGIFAWKVLRGGANSRFSPAKACLTGGAALALAGAALALAGCSHPTNQKITQTQQNGGLTVTMSVVPNATGASENDAAPGAPHSGDDTILLDVTSTATGRPVEGANITATADMVAPRIAGSEVSGRSRGNGHYEIPVRLGIAAKYDVHIQIVPLGQPPVNFVFPIEAWQ